MSHHAHTNTKAVALRVQQPIDRAYYVVGVSLAAAVGVALFAVTSSIPFLPY